MATTSKNISTNLKLLNEETLVSQDIANNKSTVKVRAIVSGTGNGAWSNYVTNGNITIDGTVYPFTVASYDFSGSVYKVLYEKTVTVTHDNYGKKTVSSSVYWNPDNSAWLDAVTVPNSMVLPDIPRASSFTASNINAGASSIPITLNKSPVASTHKATVKIGTTALFSDKDIGANPASIPITSAEWNTFYNATKTVSSGKLSITITSFNGTSSLGIDTKEITATYASSDIPTLTSITASETNTAVSGVLGAGNYLQLLSKVKLTINGASGIKGSTIDEYEIKVDSLAYNVNNSVWNPQKSGTYTAKARVKDSRGRWSAEKTLNITILAYSRPSISSASLNRADSSGNNQTLGTFVNVVFSVSVSSVIVSSSEKNQISYQIDDVTSGTVNKVALTSVVALSVSGLKKTFGEYLAENSGLVRLTVKDKFGEVITKDISVPSAEVPMTWAKKGISAGGVYDKTDTKGVGLQSFKTAHFLDDVYLDGAIDTTGTALFRGSTIFNKVPQFNSGLPVVDIATNTDMNNLINAGFYRCPSNTTVATLLNKPPTGYAFFLIVGKHAGFYQEVTEYVISAPRKWIRNYYGGTWGPWYEIVYEYSRGGDTNSGYVKYSNRTMEQWKYQDFSGITLDQSLGTTYWSGLVLGFGSWLTSFSTISMAASYSVQCSSPHVTIAGGNVTTTNAGNVYVSSQQKLTPSILRLGVRVYGTW